MAKKNEPFSWVQALGAEELLPRGQFFRMEIMVEIGHAFYENSVGRDIVQVNEFPAHGLGLGDYPVRLGAGHAPGGGVVPAQNHRRGGYTPFGRRAHDEAILPEVAQAGGDHQIRLVAFEKVGMEIAYEMRTFIIQGQAAKFSGFAKRRHQAVEHQIA